MTENQKLKKDILDTVKQARVNFKVICNVSGATDSQRHLSMRLQTILNSMAKQEDRDKTCPYIFTMEANSKFPAPWVTKQNITPFEGTEKTCMVSSARGTVVAYGVSESMAQYLMTEKGTSNVIN